MYPHNLFPRTSLIAAMMVAIPATGYSSTTTPLAVGVAPEVVVAASTLPTESYKIGNAITVLEEKDLQSMGYQYAADLLRFIPGVALNRTGGYGGITQLRLRGAEANHILVLIDGVDVSAAGSGEFDFSSLLTADIERIEVLRGPQSGLYGSNALAGVVSIHTKRPQAGAAVEGMVEYGDFKTRQASASISGGTSQVRGRVNVVQRKSSFDLSADDSRGAEKDDDDNRTISGQLNITADQALAFEFAGRLAKKNTDTDAFDFSGGPTQGLAVDDDSFSNTKDQTLSGTATLKLADNRSISRLTLAQTDNETRGATYGSQSDRKQIHMNSSWDWGKISGVGQLSTLFAEHEKETYRNKMPSDPSQIPTQERELLGYGLEHRIDIHDDFFVAGTVRQDKNDDFDDVITYSTNTAYRIRTTGSRLHASYGKGVTNPTFFEQFGFVPGMFVGNPDLAPEKSIGWDMGIEQTLLDETLLIDVTYFKANLENEIRSIFPSVVNSTEKSLRKGAELTAIYQPVEGTSIQFAYTYTDADEPGGEEVRRPMHTASLNASHYFGKKFHMAGSILYNGKQLDNDYRNYYTNGFAPERTGMPAYTLVSLNAGYHFTDELEFYGRIENLFDKEYEEVISYATPGRGIFAGFRFSFGS